MRVVSPELDGVMENNFSVLNFSTEQFPERERLERLREHYGRTVLNAEIEAPEGTPFEARIESHILPDLHLLSGTLSPARITRTRTQIADGNDDLALVISRTGTIAVTSRQRQILLRQGDAVLTSSEDVTAFERIAKGDSFSLRVPRLVLSQLLINIDDAVMRPIRQESPALRLLASYSSALMNEGALADSPLKQLAVAHLYDLLALTLDAQRDVAELAKRRGVKAARLQEAKSYIASNSARRDLSVESVAAHLGVTSRNVQRLFETDGTTFSTFLLRERLKCAHRMLCAPQFATQPVSAIAYDVGFGDLSYFNRSFRKVYGGTPSDVRNAGGELAQRDRAGLSW